MMEVEQAHLRLTLPVASNFTTSYDCNGNATSPVASYAASVIGDATNDAALLVIDAAVGTSNYILAFSVYVSSIIVTNLMSKNLTKLQGFTP